MSAPSPRQNRVNPWGEVVATPARGTLMGNRGNLHNAAGQIMRNHQVTRWIICLLEFGGRKRTVMQPGHYTELFFLDEATALAAGHRPCAECQRARYDLYRDFWAQAHGLGQRPRAGEMDAALQAARWEKRGKVTYGARLGDLPAGVIIASLEEEAAYLRWQDRLWRWDFMGYSPGPVWPAAHEVRVLTPKPSVAVLAAGYPVQAHPSLHHLLDSGKNS